jgi:hypothetical protein
MDTDKTSLKQISEKAATAQVNFSNPCPSVFIRGSIKNVGAGTKGEWREFKRRKVF